MTKSKFIISFPNATGEFLERVLKQINNLQPGDYLLCNQIPIITDATDGKVLPEHQVKEWCDEFNIKLEKPNDK